MGSVLRDFIYLDFERVRSFSAQLFKGLPSERVSGGEHKVGGEGSLSAKVPFLANASGAVDYHYLKTESETKSLHDHLFAEFFDQLYGDGRIMAISGVNESRWQESLFVDGAFIYAKCPLKIVDYKANVAFMESMPDLEALFQKISSLGSQSQGVGRPAGATKGSGRNQNQQLQGMRSQIKAMGSIMTQLYGDLIRVKALPFTSSTDKVFVGSADRSGFRYPPAALTSLYGSIIDADWTCVMQVNKGVRHAEGLTSKSGSQLEDSFEVMVDQFTTLTAMTQGVQFPAVAVTPVAIYRELS